MHQLVGDLLAFWSSLMFCSRIVYPQGLRRRRQPADGVISLVRFLKSLEVISVPSFALLLTNFAFTYALACCRWCSEPFQKVGVLQASVAQS